MRSLHTVGFFVLASVLLLFAASASADEYEIEATPGAPGAPESPVSINCSAPNATTLHPTECAAAPTPTKPTAAPSFNAAFAPVKAVTSIIYGCAYGGLNILLIIALMVLIRFFKRKSKPKSKANPGG